MTSSFDTFDFSSNEAWQAIERNLYFTGTHAENERILLKRRRKWFKANIDPNFEWDESDTGAASTSTASKPKPAAAESPKASTSSPHSSSTSSSSSATGSSPSFLKKYGVYVSWAQLALHTLLLLNAVCYLLPLLGVEQQNASFTRCMLLSLAAQSIYLLRQHGRPRWSAEYGRALFLDEQSHFLFASVVLLNAAPSFLLLTPFILRSTLFVCGGLKQVLPKASPKAYALVSRPIEMAVSKYASLYQTSALLEVLGGFMLIFQLLTPSRNLMLILGWFQYLRIRFMLSNDAKHAWHVVRLRFDGWTANPMCPAIIRTMYAKLLVLLEQYTDQEAMAQQAANSQGGLMSKCTIQ